MTRRNSRRERAAIAKRLRQRVSELEALLRDSRWLVERFAYADGSLTYGYGSGIYDVSCSVQAKVQALALLQRIDRMVGR